MVEKTKVGPVEVRRVETTVGETGLGVQDRQDVSYELGAEIDGAFVRFAAVSGAHAETMRARSEALAEQEKSDSQPATSARA